MSGERGKMQKSHVLAYLLKRGVFANCAQLYRFSLFSLMRDMIAYSELDWHNFLYETGIY